MASVSPPGRVLGGYLATLVGILSIGLAQPLLSVFTDSPEQFVFRGVGSAGIVLFVLLVLLVPPVVLWLPSALAMRTSPALAARLHAAGAFAAFTALGLTLLRALEVNGLARLAAAALAAGTATWTMHRWSAVQTWCRALAVFTPIAAINLLAFSPVADLIGGGTVEPVDLAAIAASGGPGTDEEQAVPADIVFIVLDELPTAILLNEAGQIDPVRYPNLASLAGDATWYRRFTTVSGSTANAVPALLSGRLPDETDRSPLWTDHPDTLFRLLAGSYHLAVSESFTKLCPPEWCGDEIIAPPRAVDESGPASTVPNDAPPEPQPSTFDRGGLGAILDDAWTVGEALLDPWADADPVFSGFEERIEPLPASVVTTTSQIATAEAVTGNDEAASGFTDGPHNSTNQLPRVEQFIDTLHRSDDLTLHYAHLILPHTPLVFGPDGNTYRSLSGGLGASAWEDLVTTQQFALQMSYTDRILGQILDRLHAEDMYDESMVVVVGDHGRHLDSTQPFRYFTGDNAADLLTTLLLVKQPGQHRGAVSDAPIQSIDVLPTLADALGVSIPWPIDGEVVDPTAPAPEGACADERDVVQLGLEVFGDRSGEYLRSTVCADAVMSQSLTARLGDITARSVSVAGMYADVPYARLLGADVTAVGAVTDPDGLVLSLDAGAPFQASAGDPLGRLSGELAEGDLPAWVMVAVDGRVAGFSPVYSRGVTEHLDELSEAAERQVAVVLPPEWLHAEQEVSFFGIVERDRSLEFVPIELD